MKTYFIKDAHGPHYEWLMEKTKNLVEYAKREDYKKVAAFCENILEGLRNNKLVDSEIKDGLRKKINDESITIEGDWSKEGINAAKRMGLTFTLTGRYENGFPVAKISGDRQKLIKYFKKWYDPDFFDEDYDVFDSKVVDSKLKDVRLEKGDWFVNKNDAMHADSLKLYKVIDDRNLSTNGFAKAMICEKYVARRNDDDDTYKFTIRKDGRETIHYDTYLKQNAVKFNSAEEALNWLRRQVKIRNTNKL